MADDPRGRGIHTAAQIPGTPVTGPLGPPAPPPQPPGSKPLPPVSPSDYEANRVSEIMAALRELPAIAPWEHPPGSAFLFSFPANNPPLNINPAQTLTIGTLIVP